jgi:hypothetical protein
LRSRRWIADVKPMKKNIGEKSESDLKTLTIAALSTELVAVLKKSAINFEYEATMDAIDKI